MSLTHNDVINEYSNTGTTQYAITFEYDEVSQVKVRTYDTTTNEYTYVTEWEFDGATAIRFTNVVPDSFQIVRETDISQSFGTAKYSTFVQGGAIRATDLNGDFELLRQSIEEGHDTADDQQDQINSINDEIDSIQDNIDQIEDNIDDIESELGSLDSKYVNVTGDTMTGQLAMSNQKITSLGNPEQSADAVNKQYVDGILVGSGGNISSLPVVRYILKASGGETVLNPIAPIALGNEIVTVNGSTLTPSDDYIVTTDKIPLKPPLLNGDEAMVLSYNSLKVVEVSANFDTLPYTRWVDTATAGQTVFTGIGTGTLPLAYSVGFESVFLNGSLLTRDVDYVANDQTSINLVLGAVAGDVIDVHSCNYIQTGSPTSAGGITYTYPGGVEQTVQQRLEQYASVKDFGAVGDGVADDTAAIQACFDYVKSNNQFGYNNISYTDPNTGQPANTANQVSGFGILVIIPPGEYRITDTINLTGWRFAHSPFYVEARGAFFKLEMKAKPAFDLLDSRKCMWNGGTFTTIGDPTSVITDIPKCAFQIGRDADGVASDSHRFSTMEIKGYYGWAGIYNFCSEDVYFDNVFIKNGWNNSNSYCLIQDSHNQWGVTSEFTTSPQVGDIGSFLRNTFIRCDFRKTNKGGALWIGSGAVFHQFIASYLVAGVNAVHNPPTRLITLFASKNLNGAARNTFAQLHFDLHVETDFVDNDPETGCQDVFYFDTDSSTALDIEINGLTFHDRNSHFQDSLFSLNPSLINSVTITEGDVKLTIGRDVGQVIYDLPVRYTFVGNFSNQTSANVDPALGLGSLGSSKFFGDYQVKDAASLQSTNQGSQYRIITPEGIAHKQDASYISRSNSRITHSFFDEGSFTSLSGTPELEVEYNTNIGKIDTSITGTNVFTISDTNVSPGSTNGTMNLGSGASRWNICQLNQVRLYDSTGTSYNLTVSTDGKLMLGSTVVGTQT